MNATPRAFEPQRLLRVLRANARVLVAVFILALFCGAALARMALPDEVHARGTARIVRDAHSVVSHALDDALLEAAIARASWPGSPRQLRDQLTLTFDAPDRLGVTVRAEAADAAPSALVDALVQLYVERANAQAGQGQAALAHSLASELERARNAHEQAQDKLAQALAREGYPDLFRTLAAARQRLEEDEREARELGAQLAAAEGELVAVQEVTRERPRKSARAELAQAQRELSVLLAQHGQQHAEVEAARERLKRLQAQTVELTSAALKQRMASHVAAARAQALDARVARQAAELARLQQVGARVAPLVSGEEQARARMEALESDVQAALPPSSQVLGETEVRVVDRRAQRLAASLLSPVVALLSLFALLALRELRGFRVCAPAELAYWLDVPVLASSAWPGRVDALETLVDELADPALDARGIVLVLPLTEVERPLAATLCAQLNSRAQRHYRSLTGSRVTIAQPWLGEIASPRIKRAAEAADRVLWVVAADAHRGAELRRQREVVGRHQGVAAILVDSEPGLGRHAGNTHDFWSSRAPATTGPTLAAPTP